MAGKCRIELWVLENKTYFVSSVFSTSLRLCSDVWRALKAGCNLDTAWVRKEPCAYKLILKACVLSDKYVQYRFERDHPDHENVICLVICSDQQCQKPWKGQQILHSAIMHSLGSSIIHEGIRVKSFCKESRLQWVSNWNKSQKL